MTCTPSRYLQAAFPETQRDRALPRFKRHKSKMSHCMHYPLEQGGKKNQHYQQCYVLWLTKTTDWWSEEAAAERETRRREHIKELKIAFKKILQSFSTQNMRLPPRHSSHRKGQVSHALRSNLSFFKWRVDTKLPSQLSTEVQPVGWGTEDVGCSVLIQYLAPLLSLPMRIGTIVQINPILKHTPCSTAYSASLWHTA